MAPHRFDSFTIPFDGSFQIGDRDVGEASSHAPPNLAGRGSKLTLTGFASGPQAEACDSRPISKRRRRVKAGRNFCPSPQKPKTESVGHGKGSSSSTSGYESESAGTSPPP